MKEDSFVLEIKMELHLFQNKTPHMKLNKYIVQFLLAIFCFSPYLGQGQLKVFANNGSLKIEGTSTMHDWHMASDQGKSEAIMNLSGDKLITVTALVFSVGSETLKSTKGVMMDKIAYKALKSATYPTISFQMIASTITPVDAITYNFKGTGYMTVGGNKRVTDLLATIKYNSAEKSFTSSGVKTIKMSDYDIEAPSFAFGTIKTGNDIQVHFNIKLK